jgi:hypothetical protein
MLRVLTALASLSAAAGVLAQAARFPEFTRGTSDATAKDSSPLADVKELTRRLNVSKLAGLSPPPAYDVTAEKFKIIVPDGYSHDQPWGLFVWLPGGKQPDVPSAWPSVLAEHKLLYVSAYNGGGGRDVYDRLRLAIDGAHLMKQRFNIDAKRVYIAGGGGAGQGGLAVWLGVGYSDVFAGTAAIGTVYFYKNVPGDAGKVYPGYFTPTAKALAAARKDGRFALAANSADPNGLAVKRTYDKGFKAEGFKKVTYIEFAKGEGGSPGVLKKCLDFLDAGK